MIEGKIAVIDIGSNSVRLLIAQVADSIITDVYKDLNTTRLYQNISDEYILDDGSMKRTINAISEFVDISKENAVSAIYMFATAAVRVAKNKSEFVEKVRNKTNINLEIISQSKEAALAFAGVGCDGLCGIVDIGGASTEIVIGKNGKIIVVSSAKIGAVKCKEIIKCDSDTNKVEAFVDSLLIPANITIISEATKHNSIKWYGVGGSITTMAAMINKLDKYDSSIINKTEISYKSVNAMIGKLQAIQIQKRMNIVGLQPKRADIIVYGLIILKMVMEKCNIESIHSSDNDNLAGYIQLLIKEARYDNAHSHVEA